MRSEDTEDLILDAIASVKAEAWLASNASRILVQAVDSACAQYAEVRSVPYRCLLQLLQRQLPTVEALLARVGLSSHLREGLLRTLARSTEAREWSEAKNPDELLLQRIVSICASYSRRSG